MAVRGVAVAMIAGGFVLAYSAIKNATVTETVQDIVTGKPVQAAPDATAGSIGAVLKRLIDSGAFNPPEPGAAPSGTEPGASATEGGAAGTAAGQAIVADAAKYLGIKYVFGGASPSGFDCSGLVTYVLHHDLGYNLPSNAHTVAAQFYVWSGAVDVPYASMQPGDLVCYGGHIGIASGGGQMINAPTFGEVVKYSKIWTVPAPKIRRVKAQQ